MQIWNISNVGDGTYYCFHWTQLVPNRVRVRVRDLKERRRESEQGKWQSIDMMYVCTPHCTLRTITRRISQTLNWCKSTRSGSEIMGYPFMLVLAFWASSCAVKQTNPKHFFPTGLCIWVGSKWQNRSVRIMRYSCLLWQLLYLLLIKVRLCTVQCSG